MALANYSDLQAAVAAWHHRDPGVIPDCITLAEKRINKLLYDRLAEVETTLTATIGNRYIALPTGYQANYGLWLTTYGNRIEIKYKTPEELPIVTDSNGQPYYYTIDGSNIAFDYPASIAYTFVLRYKKGYDIAATTTNHVMTNHPNCYLFGAMVEASVFSEDDQAALRYEARFQQAIEEAINDEKRNRAMTELSSDASIVGNRFQNIITGDI